ncbi:MAG: efflux RND transporter periplasmic adaptor subunit [Paludibacteraceae bacterium]|jgi:cobalt-zinc-cadmium efflux system membrane fusion protein|nr:efflux RND transporter periplasmic adaptor subunit [Paludibacteraceae bacterium]
MKYIHIIIVVLLFTSCSDKTFNEEKVAKTHTDIVTTEVTLGKMNGELVLTGDIACDERKLSKIFVPCTGKIRNIEAEIGDPVSKGQTLATVFSSEAADYVKQTSEINSQIRVAERNLNQLEDMYSARMTTEKNVLEAREELNILRAELERLDRVAQVNGYSKMSTASLVSPISGFVVAKTVFNDSYIDATNNDNPAFEIADISTVWVMADVYESDIWKVHTGDSVTVIVAAYPNEHFKGVINKVYNILDNVSKTMKVRICLDNKDGLLKPGMFASVHVAISGDTQQMLQVPAGSIVFENGHDYVVVCDEENHQRRQQVKIAGYNDNVAFISSGIKKGDMVVSENALMFFEALR